MRPFNSAFEPGEAPSLATIHTWIRNDTIEGRIVNTGKREQFWVNAAAWEAGYIRPVTSMPEP